ncbi:hypothetical protein BGZ95_005617 [Linnemannia exigua]|uniref:F-box domain-containing protein n=1 Tax=Linnemannia exigua TaxID=604196 RepID=A0AAD4DLM5_9FUNG|nr:hypothetical protein BGZ95_005617 [Linnemannia exigua]
MTIVHIPDVLHLVGSHLNTYDLVACLQVNRLWNSVFIAHLWRTIDDSQRPWRRLLAKFADPTPTYYNPQEQHARLVERVPDKLLDLFLKYGHFIRTLVIRRPQTVELCLRARDIARTARRREQAEQALAEPFSSSVSISTSNPRRATGAGTADDRGEILPCEGITILRFGFLDPVLTFLKRLDLRQYSQEALYLTALSATLLKNQCELQPSLDGVPLCLFVENRGAVSSRLHMVTLARSCWQLVLNNPKLQELDMGPFGVHEDTFFGPGDFLKSTLASLQRLRALRVSVEGTPDFLVRLPTTLPNLKLLWYHDKSPAGLDALVEETSKARGSGTVNSAGREITGGVTSDSDGTQRMPSLRLLDVVAPSQPRHLAAIFSSFPDLVMLSLGVLNVDDASVSRSGMAADKGRHDATVLLPQHLGTRLLELHVVDWGGPATILRSSNIHFNSVTRLNLQRISGYKKLFDLLRTFPALQELQLKRLHTLHSEVDPSYETELPLLTLKSIRLSKEPFGTECRLNGLLSLLPNLAEARLYTIHPSTLATIAAHCPLIEILEFTKKSHINSQLSLLLTHCPNIKSCVGPGLQIAYQDIFNHPWVCKDLQKLDCQITGIPCITEDEIASIKYLRNHYSQNITLPLAFDMPRFPKSDPAFTHEDNWDMRHPGEQLAFRKYSTLLDVLCGVYDLITKYTILDTVQQDRTTLSSCPQTLWTSSRGGRPASSLGRPLKATSRVLSNDRARWIHFSL